jgi:glycosyltransferase involved in cell wall biosynthesis
LSQIYANFELFISDDASKDNTVAIIEQFKDERIVLIKQDVNLGYAYNMNFLLKAAKGNYILIQDADDYAAPERIEVLLNQIVGTPEVDVLGSAYVKFDEEGREEVRKNITGENQVAEQFEIMSDPLPVLNGTLLLKRKIVEDGILFRDLKFVTRGQDDDWLFRLSEKYKIDNVSDVLYYYRLNSNSMTLNPTLITYESIFAAEFVRFLKMKRTEDGLDLLEGDHRQEIASFFNQKKLEITRENPAYLESYIAHRYLAMVDFANSIRWLLKALRKNLTNIFIWKKIIYVAQAWLKRG